MKLNIPQQNAPTKASSPSNPRKLKKVLSALPNTNMGELTKQTFQILRDQNRQTMPSTHRLENLEAIRVLAREIFSNLKKYFINRTLPLPDKSQKIINLNQSILQELIYGYEIIAQQADTNEGDKVEAKTLTIAICRSLNYLSEMLLRASEVYEPCPKNLWQDAHQLYVLAENKKIIDKVVINEEKEITKTTIGDSYKQILLFTLARPISLRQSDNDRIYKELFKWSQYANIKPEASEDMVDCVFCMHVDTDNPPNYLSKENVSTKTNLRILDTRDLVAHISDLVTAQSKEKQKLAVGDTISLETLSALISSWGESPKRKFSRAEQVGHINVAIGLTKICKVMHEPHKVSMSSKNDEKFSFMQTPSSSKEVPIDASHDFFQTPDSSDSDSSFTLQSIGKEKQQHTPPANPLSHNENENEDKWDMVAKGRVLTDTYEREKKLINKEELGQKQGLTDTHWEIVNISAGGYCLRWNSDDTSKAQIGELIALQEPNAQHDVKWHVGVIRWMQFTHENGLEIGVQILSPQVVTATAQRANRLDEIPFDCLMLPNVDALNQTSSALLPSHAFKTDAKLIVRVFEHRLNITLGEIKEHTGSFTQFSYNNTDLDQRIKHQAKKQESMKHKDDFDELWSSL